MNVRFSIEEKTEVSYDGRPYIVTHVVDMDTVLANPAGSDKVTRLPLHGLKPAGVGEADPFVHTATVTASDDAWERASKRLAAIKPLLDLKGRSRADIETRAREVGVHPATLYRWLKAHESEGTTSALLAAKSGPKGNRLVPEVETIIEETIKEVYLSDQRFSVKDTCDEVVSRCKAAKLKAPHPNTVRNRITEISDRTKALRRRGRKAAADYEPQVGKFPNATFPLETVQIDHTPFDVELVDDIYRLPIGRPYATVAIDVYSRVGLGFYISFDPPNANAVGMCLYRAILPKHAWLEQLGVDATWDCWGFPEAVHADNAKEFRGKMLERACEEYDIISDFRGNGEPKHGAHIERLMGTFATDIQKLPGTTFSNYKDKGEYDSEKKAIMTLSEFESWFANLLMKYHNRPHMGIMSTPAAKYKRGIFGTKTELGRGLPEKATDEMRLRLDFMPYDNKHSVQRYGIAFNYIEYYSDVLHPWIGARDPDHPKEPRYFTFRYDPRDLSRIYFLDPDLDTYFEIPYGNALHPPVSIWEVKRAIRHIKKVLQQEVDEDALFKAIAEMRRIESEAARKTKSARRNVQRRSDHAKAAEDAPVAETTTKTDDTPDEEAPFMFDDLEPFDELEEG